MFSGIVEEIGRIAGIVFSSDICCVDIEVSANFIEDVVIGASIACSGVCLTVVAKEKQNVSVELSAETLRCTTAKGWYVDMPINLEKALKVNERLDGHIVTGHVDAVTTFLAITDKGNGCRTIECSIPEGLAVYFAEKGSITLDGVSLTINEVDSGWFRVTIIPHTFKHTTFYHAKIGQNANIEVDILARYTQRFLQIHT